MLIMQMMLGCCCCAAGVISSTPVEGTSLSTEYYIATNGNDSAAGTLEAPWKSVEKARDVIRSLALPDGGVTVWIRGGTYTVEETIVFDERDSGTSTNPITYKAYQFEEPVFCGCREITGWTLDSGSVYRAAVDTGTWRFDQLFENGVRQTKARYPNSGYLRTDAPTDSPRHEIKFRPGALAAWTNTVGAQVSIWAYANWFENIVPISSIDAGTRVITLSNPMQQQNVEDDRYFIQGVREELDTPGEFYLDEPGGYVYYWPLTLPIANQTIEAPVVTNVFGFKGTSFSNKVEHITFEGLAVWGSKFTTTFRGGGYVTGPAYSVNRPGEENRQGLIQLENASHIAIRNCKLSDAGYCGVNLGYYASHNTLHGNEIVDCGWHGVLMVGKDNGEGVVDDPSEQIYDNKFNAIRNNHIHRCGEIIGDAAGVFLYQSGDNDIAHNLIHDMPRYGICLKGHGGLYGKYTTFGNVTITDENYWDFYTGNHNTIRHNHVYDVLQDSYDPGAISFRRPGRNNTIVNNRIHAVRPPASMDYHFSFGIYLDGGTQDTTISSNVIYGVKPGQPAFAAPINMKKLHHTVVNNIIVAETDASGGVIAMQEGGGSQPVSDGYGDHTITRNVFYAKGESATLYWFKSEDEFDSGLVNVSDNNLFYLPDGGTYTFKDIDGDDTYGNWKTLYADKYDQNSSTANPRFRDPTHHNFNLKATSAAWALGFEAIDQEAVGLEAGFPVAHSPRPYDRQRDGTLADLLSWTGGPHASAFDVYLGDSYVDVAGADTNSDAFMVSQTNTSYAPAALHEKRWYFWRVDERNAGDLISRGDVWSFKTIEAVGDLDLIATNAAATLDINTEAAVITYDEDGAGPVAPVTFTASTSAGTAIWTFGDLAIGSDATVTVSGDNRRGIKFIATGMGPLGNGDIRIGKNFRLDGANGGGNGSDGGERTFGSGAGGDDGVGAEVRAGESGASDAYTTVGGIGGGRYTDNDTESRGGGGGGFGGDGGDSNSGMPRGGSWYGRLDLSDLGTTDGPRAGSGGGAANRGSGGAGGGAIQLLAVNDITLASGVRITTDGGRGASSSTDSVEKRRTGGGGSGGGIRLMADSDGDGSGVLTCAGVTLSAVGGVSDNTTITAEYGGDGGGGRIALSGAAVVRGAEAVSGGNHGRPVCRGDAGSVFVDAYNGELVLSGNGVAANSYARYAALTVSAKATLELDGIGGGEAVTVSNGSPATIAGTLVMDIDGASDTNDALVVANGLTVSGATLDLDAISALDDAVYVLVEYGSLAGTFATTKGIPADYALKYNYGVSSNQIAIVSTTIDHDEDGMLDAWEVDRFGDVTISDGTGNQDGDRHTDLQEYIADTNPKDIESYLWLSISRTTNTAVQQLEFPSSLNREYWVESAPDLSGDSFAPASPIFTGEGGLTLWNVTNSLVGDLYYRIRVTLP